MLVRLGLVISIAVASSAQSSPQPIRSGFGAGAYPLGATYANLINVVEPEYPPAAIQAGIEGEVTLEAVVGEDGRVKEVRVTKSLDAALGLDASAVAAVRQWRFGSPTINGQRVSVVVSARVTFHLRMAGDAAVKPFTESGLVGGPEGAVSATTPGLTLPMLKRQTIPRYTADAMRQKIQGLVEIEAVVGVDGRVTSARVVKSLDRGLDRQALAAAREWLFAAGRLNGVAVPVTVILSLEFRLR